MTTRPTDTTDQDVVALAKAERDAGVPDMQTAQAAADVKAGNDGDAEPEAHPS